jgi:hypothetical protein
MCGNATFATDESSTTMNVAIITDTAIIHGFTEGVHSRCWTSFSFGTLLTVLIRLRWYGYLE